MKTRDLTLSALFVALMTIGAYISIPTPWVPLTFQPFFACLSGIFLGPKLAPLSQIVYVLLGLIGLPVFQGGHGGPASIFSPTFGYLIGFIISSYIIGKIYYRNKPTFKSTLLSILIGTIIIYILGLFYLYIIMNLYLGNNFGFIKILQIGLFPFILKDLIFAFIASILGFKVTKIRGLTYSKS